MFKIKKISAKGPEYKNIKEAQFFYAGKLSSAIENICLGDDIQLYIAEKNNDICGFAIADRATKDAISLLFLAVSPEQRRSGIATAMLDYILEDTKAKAVVAEAFEESIEFFKKYGFYYNDLGEKYPGKHVYYVTYRVIK